MISRCLVWDILGKFAGKHRFLYFDALISPFFGEAFLAYYVFSQGASLSHNAWSGALHIQDEALSPVRLAVTHGVALPATPFFSVSLTCFGRNAGFSLFYSFNFFYSRLILVFSCSHCWFLAFWRSEISLYCCSCD